MKKKLKKHPSWTPAKAIALAKKEIKEWQDFISFLEEK